MGPTTFRALVSPPSAAQPRSAQLGCLDRVRGNDLKLRDPQHRVLVFALDDLGLAFAPLLFYLAANRLSLGANDDSAALKKSLADPGIAFQGEISGANDACPVESEYVSRQHIGHLEGQADRVARRDEVRLAVDVEGDVV